MILSRCLQGLPENDPRTLSHSTPFLGQRCKRVYVFWLHQIKEFSVNLQVKFPHMKNSTSYESIKDYQTPSLRVIEADLELSFLQSNLEPIGGGDDPDIDW